MFDLLTELLLHAGDHLTQGVQLVLAIIDHDGRDDSSMARGDCLVAPLDGDEHLLPGPFDASPHRPQPIIEARPA